MNERGRFYATTLRISWATMTKRERKRIFRRYPLIAISVDHLLNEGHLAEGADAD